MRGVRGAEQRPPLADVLYRPSPFSRFLEWAVAQPGRGWWLPVLFAAILLAWGHGILWWSGRLPFGTAAPLILTSAVYGPYALAILLGLNVVVRRSVSAFWPATGWSAAELPTWTWRFTHRPARYDLGLVVIGIGTALASAIPAAESTTESLGGDAVAAQIALAPTWIGGYLLFPFVVAHTVHQLRLVTRIHAEATAIDPFDRGPIYAFSRLTGLAGIMFVAPAYYGLTIGGSWQANNPVSSAVLGLAVCIGAFCFVAPLWGIHERLAEEKHRRLGEAERRVSAVAAEIGRRIDAGAFEATEDLDGWYGAAAASRDRIAHLPTWPWPPQLFRGFVSALLLPIIVYVTSRALDAILRP